MSSVDGRKRTVYVCVCVYVCEHDVGRREFPVWYLAVRGPTDDRGCPHRCRRQLWWPVSRLDCRVCKCVPFTFSSLVVESPTRLTAKYTLAIGALFYNKTRDRLILSQMSTMTYASTTPLFFVGCCVAVLAASAPSIVPAAAAPAAASASALSGATTPSSFPSAK